MNRIVLILTSCFLGSCGSSSQSPPATTPVAPSANTTTFADQVTRGAVLYSENCAGCHGASGQGDSGPPVVGLADGALPLHPPAGAELRDVEFRTGLDVFLWVKTNMPPNKGGSLTDEQYVDILAFDLKANGVELPAPLDAASAKKLVLHQP